MRCLEDWLNQLFERFPKARLADIGQDNFTFEVHPNRYFIDIRGPICRQVELNEHGDEAHKGTPASDWMLGVLTGKKRTEAGELV